MGRIVGRRLIKIYLHFTLASMGKCYLFVKYTGSTDHAGSMGLKLDYLPLIGIFGTVAG